MFKRLRRGFFVGVALLFMLCLGFATPALAEGEPTYAPGDAKLTAIIVAPVGTDATGDKYVFHFAGGGTVTAVKTTDENDNETTILKSDGVVQDNTTIKVGDEVPKIGDDNGDVTLDGIALTNGNSLTNGQLGQTVVQKPLSEILSANMFPHAGVYTYEVTESSATTNVGGNVYINASAAKYCLRVRVKNTNTGADSDLGNKDLTVESVTVERLKDDDNGSEASGKVNPTYPKANDNGMITSMLTTEGAKDPVSDQLAGDVRGRNVLGFTFANEYLKGGNFQVKKLYDGNHSDRTRYSTIELAVYSPEADSANVATTAADGLRGYVLSYRIEGKGNDLTEGNKVNGGHLKLNGVGDISQGGDYMAQFDDYGWCYITAQLKEDDSICITGEFGPYNTEENNSGTNQRNILPNIGLELNQFYYVVERDPGDYRPKGYEYVGEGLVDPRKDPTGMTETPGNGDTSSIDIRNEISSYPVSHLSNDQAEVRPFGLFMQGSATGSATTIFVVNNLDEAKVSATGIFVDNLPYILMIGVPLVVFAGMFVAKRRGNAA